jgi:hypothetical protein
LLNQPFFSSLCISVYDESRWTAETNILMENDKIALHRLWTLLNNIVFACCSLYNVTIQKTITLLLCLCYRTLCLIASKQKRSSSEIRLLKYLHTTKKNIYKLTYDFLLVFAKCCARISSLLGHGFVSSSSCFVCLFASSFQQTFIKSEEF